MAQSFQLTWADTDSSNVQCIAYDEQTQTLCVRFVSGALYSYSDVPMDVYYGLLGAESVGTYLDRAIKGIYAYEKWFTEIDLLADILARRK